MYSEHLENPGFSGCLVRQFVRCGKDNCRCRRGRLHGPYWYLKYRIWEDFIRRQRKRYVPAHRVAEVREALGRAGAMDRAVRSLLGRSQKLRGAVRRRAGGRIDEEEFAELIGEMSRAGTPV